MGTHTKTKSTDKTFAGEMFRLVRQAERANEELRKANKNLESELAEARGLITDLIEQLTVRPTDLTGGQNQQPT